MCVAILDFGSQYSHLIVRRIRGLGYNAFLLPPSTTYSQLRKLSVKAVILSGGPQDAYIQGSLRVDHKILDSELPLLGICYGHQLLTIQSDGLVERGEKAEYGIADVKINNKNSLFRGIKTDSIQVWMSHSDKVQSPPKTAKVLASSATDMYTALEFTPTRFSVQFHPEVSHTEFGLNILSNFMELTKCEKNWNPSQIYTDIHNSLLGKEGNILMAVSGGVDSTVAAALINEIYPDNLYCVYVDTGLMRDGETEYVKSVFNKLHINHLFIVEAQDLFLSRLKGVKDPEQKRKIIGQTFIEIFVDESKKLEKQFGNFSYLGQGTIYPDRVESSFDKDGNSKVIKSHHNVGGLPDYLPFDLIEPLKELYKDEVREIGKRLKLDEEFLSRQPFPGPGLAVRILGTIDEEKLNIVRKADKILHEELKRNNLIEKAWQFYAALLPIKTVGVKGDARSYENSIVIRIIDSIDGMTADIIDLPKKEAVRISSRIVNEIDGVNRVFYDITQKPPATIELE